MAKVFITLTGTKHYFGNDFLKKGTKIRLVQKFLNKWTIFLFCSILFSSNQKEH